jgi:hypothetical protein
MLNKCLAKQDSDEWTVTYHGEWNRNVRLKMHVNIVCPEKQKEILEQRVV